MPEKMKDEKLCKLCRAPLGVTFNQALEQALGDPPHEWRFLNSMELYCEACANQIGRPLFGFPLIEGTRGKVVVYFRPSPPRKKIRKASYERICPGCGCKMLIEASGEDEPGFRYGDTAICHCGADLGTPYSNPFSVYATLVEKHPGCGKAAGG